LQARKGKWKRNVPAQKKLVGRKGFGWVTGSPPCKKKKGVTRLELGEGGGRESASSRKGPEVGKKYLVRRAVKAEAKDQNTDHPRCEE